MQCKEELETGVEAFLIEPERTFAECSPNGSGNIVTHVTAVASLGGRKLVTL